MVSYATCKEVAERTGGRAESLKGGKSWPAGRRWDNAHSYVGWRGEDAQAFGPRSADAGEAGRCH